MYYINRVMDKNHIIILRQKKHLVKVNSYLS